MSLHVWLSETGGNRTEVAALDFQVDLRDALGMEKAEHARRLRAAIATSDRWDRQALADYLGRSYRTVSNWVSETKPMLPSDQDRGKLRALFPGYDQLGDPVEVALRQSELHEWRQDAVLSVYKRNLHEQREERAG